jgi:asparagine synthase (glutamine-hydrolysing)
VLEADFLSTVAIEKPLEHLRSVYLGLSAQTLINRMLGLDYKFTLADNDLRKVSTMAAVAGVDVAYPFLDEAVIAFANALPAEAKVRGRRLRVFFKQALADFLPAEIIAKRKQGFGLPFGVWLTTHEGLGELARDSLNVLAGRGIIRPTLINALLDSKLKEHAHYHGGLVWVLMMLEQWLRHHDRARQPANWPQPTSVELQILPQPRVGVAGGEA